MKSTSHLAPLLATCLTLLLAVTLSEGAATPPEGSTAPPAPAELRAEPQAELKAEPKAKVKAEPKAKVKAEPKAKVKAEPKAKVKAEPKAKVKAEPQAELKAEPKAELKAEPQAELKVEPKAELKAEPQAELKVEPQAELKAEPQQAGEGAPTILLLTGLHGYIAPCGCTIDLTLGSLERLAAKIRALKARGPVALLVAGGHLFEHAELPKHRHAQDGAKARLLRDVLQQLGVDAILPGPQDLALGQRFYQELHEALPARDPSVNLPGGAPLLLSLKGLTLGVIGLGAEGSTHPLGQTYLAPEPAARAAAQLLKAQGAQLVIALGALPRAELRALAQRVPEVELWALAEDALEQPSLSPIEGSRGHYLIEAGDRGRHLASLELYDMSAEGELSDPQGERARATRELELKLKMKRRFSGSASPFGASPFGAQKKGDELKALEAELEALKRAPLTQEGRRVLYTLTPISGALPIDEQVEAQVKAYHASLKELNLKSAGEPVPLPEGANGYAKQAECALCHPSAVSFWENTKHASAWETLEEGEKTFDVECVGCHVTGFQLPGGSALGHTEGLEDVQCEACHGPSAQHAMMGGGESGTKLKVEEAVCVTCHNELHSPKFSYVEYLKQVIGPGHGAPVAPQE